MSNHEVVAPWLHSLDLVVRQAHHEVSGNPARSASNVIPKKRAPPLSLQRRFPPRRNDIVVKAERRLEVTTKFRWRWQSVSEWPRLVRREDE